MPIKQSYAQYGDGCATAHALELLGDRWTYPVLREVLLGPKRFGELATAVRGITPAVLTARLREMELNGLIARHQLPQPSNVAVYEATAWARETAPAFALLARWAQNSPTFGSDGGLTPDSAVHSMLAMAPLRAHSPALEIMLNLYDARELEGKKAVGYFYHVSWAEQIKITRDFEVRESSSTAHDGLLNGVSARVRADSSTWVGILYNGSSLDLAEIEGSHGEVKRFVSSFRESPVKKPAGVREGGPSQ